MKYEKYDIHASSSNLEFEFYSEGPRGTVAKSIRFEEIEGLKDAYNLSFGDVGSDGEIDDLVVTDNGDSEKVLATVASAIRQIFINHPGAFVHITGSTPSRTRLYRIAISNNLEELQNDFHILGSLDEWMPFERNMPYSAFIVTSKSNTFET